MGSGNWIAGATSKHKGSFRKAAKSAGMSTGAFANKELRAGSGASAKMKKRASLAKTLSSFHKK